MRRSALVLLSLLSIPVGCTVDASSSDGEATGSTESAMRRRDFGQNRRLAIIDQAGTLRSNLPVDLDNTFTPVAGTFQSFGVTSLREAHWAGDANTYLDVFETSLSTEGRFATTGAVARYQYPFASNSMTRGFFFCLPGYPCGTPPPATETTVRLDLTSVFPGRVARSIRMYDRGECSGEAPWAEVLDGIGRGIATGIDGGLRARGLSGASFRSMTGTPRIGTTLSGNADDHVSIRSEYNVNNCSGRMYVNFSGKFAVTAGRPSFRLDPGTLNVSLDFGDDFCAGGLALGAGFGFDAGALQTSISSGVRTALSTQLEPGVDAALLRRVASAPVSINCTPTTDCRATMSGLFRLGGFTAAADALTSANVACLPRVDNPSRNECTFVPTVPRVNTRVDGLEIVVANHSTDPFLPPMRSAGVCNRPEPAAAPTIGFLPLANPLTPTLMTAAPITTP